MDVFRELVKAAGETVGRYQLISEGDRILAGLSGGKDSFAMLHALHHLRSKAPVKFDILAVTFDPGFPEFNVEGIVRYGREHGWEHAVVKLDIPALAAEYAGILVSGIYAFIEDTLRITPFFFATISFANT